MSTTYSRLMKVTLLLGLLAVLAAPLPVAASDFNTLRISSVTWGYAIDNKLYGTQYYSENTAEMNVVLDTFQDVFAYCVDLPQAINIGTTYSNLASVAPGSEAGSVGLSTLQAAWLMGHFAPGLGYDAQGYTLKQEITALQLAIWEVTYDYAASYAAGSLGAGNFILNNIRGANSTESAAVQFLANQHLASLPGTITNTGLGWSAVTRDPKVQDILLGKPPAAGSTPEPASMLLMGSSLAGMGLWRRLRRRRAARNEAPKA